MPCSTSGLREAEAFKKDCARNDGGLDWLQISSPLDNSSKSGNIIHLSTQIREATRSQPVLISPNRVFLARPFMTAICGDDAAWQLYSATFGRPTKRGDTGAEEVVCSTPLGFQNSTSCWIFAVRGPLG